MLEIKKARCSKSIKRPNCHVFGIGDEKFLPLRARALGNRTAQHPEVHPPSPRP